MKGVAVIFMLALVLVSGCTQTGQVVGSPRIPPEATYINMIQACAANCSARYNYEQAVYDRFYWSCYSAYYQGGGPFLESFIERC